MSGDIVLAALPQTDGQVEPRPAVLLRQMPPFNDWLVCGVSTQLHQRVRDFDELITAAEADFVLSGLKAPSVIRLGFLATLSPRRILGVIGSISGERRQRLLRRLAEHLQGDPSA